MNRWEIKHSVEQMISNGLSPIDAIQKLLDKLNIKDVVDPLLWLQQTIGGE